MALRLLIAIAFAGVTPESLVAEPIHSAATIGDFETVHRLLAEGTPVDQFDTTDPYGRETTALYKATMASRTEVPELLLDASANPTLRSLDSLSVLHPLQTAAKFGRTEILKMFLESGANPNAPGKESTALHLALVSQHPEIVRILLDAGASPSIEQPSIVAQLSKGNPERGRQIFVTTCRYCHREPLPNDTPTSSDRIANLWGVVGRDMASVKGAIYSEPMKAIEGVWTYDRLNSLIALPGGFVPGTVMHTFCTIICETSKVVST